MPGLEIVTRITAETMDSVLVEEDKPVLLACIRHDVNLRETLKVLHTVAAYAGPSVRVCYATEDLLAVTENRFQVTGTPTFLLIEQGTLVDSLLGKTTAPDLVHFLRNTLNAVRPTGRTQHSGQEIS